MIKNLAIIIIIISLGTIGTVGYLYYVNFMKTGTTGAIYSPPTAQEVAEGNAIANLQNALPISSGNFAINAFDYSQGQFIVTFNGKSASPSAEFYAWYTSSSYTGIPLSLFTILASPPAEKD